MITVFFVFLLGAIFGSFASAILYRARHGGSVVRGRSHCPSCKQNLSPLQLVPLISWLVQAGTCRMCKAKISWQYPALELVTGALFVGAFYRACGSFADTSVTGVCLVGGSQNALFLFLLMLVFVYDARHGEIPDAFSVVGIVAGLGLHILNNPSAWWGQVLATLVGAAFFGVQYVISRGKWIGSGDILLGAMIGAVVGWPAVLGALYITYLLGLFVVLFFFVSKRKRWGETIPLGPLLTVGAAVMLLTSAEMLIYDFFRF